MYLIVAGVIPAAPDGQPGAAAIHALRRTVIAGSGRSRLRPYGTLGVMSRWSDGQDVHRRCGRLAAHHAAAVLGHADARARDLAVARLAA